MKKYSTILIIFILAGFINCTNKPESKQQDPSHQHSVDHIHVHDYVCPMHPEIRGHEGERCPKCGMALEHTDEEESKSNYTMLMSTLPEDVMAGKEATLLFTPKNIDNEKLLVPLDIVHEKKIHLILVSEDLSWFDHIHPEYKTDGSYTISALFPHGGTYFLYADYKPSGASHKLEKFEIKVSGNSAISKHYTKAINTCKKEAFTVTLKPDDGQFNANEDIHFDGVFLKDKRAFDANNLQNYLGAKGHMVAIHTVTKEYMHIHPEVEGSILHFHTHFENTGMYRVWLQFMDEGKLYTTDFNILVLESGKKNANKDKHTGHAH